ncbi:MAG: B12-binding domain-containing radical SAM protein [Syntrophales bacterium LBB04]|nr:B12-binding domain-containing radical SAM protein [Syntrophales bacterium LBB04]
MPLGTILLINPWIHDFSAYDFWVRPLGLLTLAALLRRSDFEVQVIDCLDPFLTGMAPGGQSVTRKRQDWGCGKFPSEEIQKPEALRPIRRRYRRYGLSPNVLREILQATGRPDLVLVSSMMTYWYPGVVEAIGEVRKVWPGVTVLLGGNYATLCPDHARAVSGADVVIPGDGEFALPPILGDLFGVQVDFAFDGSALDSYPYPALDLVHHLDAVPILTSRGCPYRCSYCASHLLNHRFRIRDPIRVVDEIEHWSRKYGAKHVAFYDDALLVNSTERAVPMLEEILRRGLAVNFHCPNGLHLREMTPRLAHLLHRSGFRTIRFGFETASSSRQTETGGKVTTEELRQAVAYLREAGYGSADIGIYLLCGLPGQEAEEIDAGIDLVREIGAKPILAEYSPIPGTALWDEAVRRARYDIMREPLFQNNSLLPCLRSDISTTDFQALKNRTRLGVQREGIH